MASTFGSIPLVHPSWLRGNPAVASKSQQQPPMAARRSSAAPARCDLLNGVLDCLEGVDRLQETLVRTRRELSNLAKFGNKQGWHLGSPANPAVPTRTPGRSNRKQRKAAARNAGAGADAGVGAGGGSRKTRQRPSKRARARARRQAESQARPDGGGSPEIKVESDVEGGTNVRAPLGEIPLPNRAVAQPIWQK
ncbi:hypothetical protein PG994_004106 [Apiospora phragmitis]|uniref:Uncharacterized protein n=1 Tax=Apiospora phragmitis TaxID=2905665 RepID=A0ABR1VQT2_9PEZI